MILNNDRQGIILKYSVSVIDDLNVRISEIDKIVQDNFFKKNKVKF